MARAFGSGYGRTFGNLNMKSPDKKLAYMKEYRKREEVVKNEKQRKKTPAYRKWARENSQKHRDEYKRLKGLSLEK